MPVGLVWYFSLSNLISKLHLRLVISHAIIKFTITNKLISKSRDLLLIFLVISLYFNNYYCNLAYV